MNLFQLSKQLTKLYNKLGNEWLTNEFDTEPFDFTVYVKKGDEILDKGDYLVQIYSNPWMPKSFNRNGKKVRLEKISNKFEEMAKYITELDDTFEIKFMDVNFRD
jgi:hypothetical protein